MNHHHNVDNNNNNPMRRNFNFGNPGSIPMTINHNPPQQGSHMMISQSQLQPTIQYPSQFQISGLQAQAIAQSQLAQAQPHALVQQAQAQQGKPNVGVSSPSSAPGSGGAGSGKRALNKPPSRPAGGSSGQGTAAPMMKTMELAPAVTRRKRKVPNNEILDKVAAIVPESALYTQLLEFESRVDAALMRKKTDILESVKNPVRARKTLRIYVFNTFANQTQSDPDNENAEPASWSLKIAGRILEDGKDPVLGGAGQNSLYPKFSSYFKKITIYLDQSLYPDNHVILWESSRSPVLNEGFEVKRKGNKEFKAIIRFEMNYIPEKFKLSPALQEVLGLEMETRSRILVAIWHYVKMRKLQKPDDTSSFMCDPPLRNIFGEEKMKFAAVSEKITPHLIAPGPLHLEHRIKLSGDSPSGNTCYDVLVDVPLLLEHEKTALLVNLEKNKEIEAWDEAITSAIKKIHEHRKRRAFFLGFSQSPAEFINALISSQARDLRLAAADASSNVEKERRAEFYNQPWTEDAVIRYLNRKQAGVNDTAGSK